MLLTQELPYSTAHHLAQELLGVSVARSTLYRLTMHYGQALEPALAEPIEVQPQPDSVVYAMADGLMLLFDEGYKEVKLGRLFAQSKLSPSPVANRGGCIAESTYVAHVGSWADFWPNWQKQIEAWRAAGQSVVFLNDGVSWLQEKLRQAYPDSLQILDIYHVMEQLAGLARQAISGVAARQKWLAKAYELLTHAGLDVLLKRIDRLAVKRSEAQRVAGYLKRNRSRMAYGCYLAQGLCIGSGAIESANKAVVQQRMKRAGQRWSKPGAQRVLNLRSCWMSGRWPLVKALIEPGSYSMAA
ncbi:hypothetical protein GCM10023187_57750 [Nibrella viscosa]|uniref:Transposase n=1 Tax=Nibrella viscosa TaxID=1084524 RepID=A0ABP8L3V8_9BACT